MNLPRWRKLFTAAAVLCSLALVCLALYLVYLDRVISETFDGRRWSVPAIVYAQPLELYPGAKLSLADVTAELDRLGYRQLANLSDPGTYKRTDQRLDIHLRAFQFMERMRAGQQISLQFGNSSLTGIADVSGRPVPLIRLDPLNIGSFFPSHGEDRIVLQPDQVPVLLSEGLKSVEDTEFDNHLGFSIKGIARAAWVNLGAGEIQQGGSTLTQQLVKSYYLHSRQTYTRKLREVAMAILLELRYSKQDLLNAYINEIYLGQDGVRAVHGFGLGSQFYFNKPLSELDVHELATLVAIIRGPSFYNPYRHPQRVHERRDLVLHKMAKAGLIDDVTLAQALRQPFHVVAGSRSGGAYYPAFMDKVRQELTVLYAEQALTSEGLRVFTTLSPRTQDAIEAALADGLEKIEQDHELPAGELQGAIVVADTQTGEILALAGGRTAGFDGFNRALNAARPVGSLLKPVVYLSALERGYNLASEIADVPVTLEMRGQLPWSPANFDGKTHGPVPLVRALGDSLNLATVNLGLSIGVDQIAQRLSELTGTTPTNQYPSLLLGAEPMTPLAVLQLYSSFASGGFAMTPKSVVAVLDEAGNPITHHPFQLNQLIDHSHAAAINRAMEIVMRDGTGKTSRFAHSGVAGKTGTSDDYRDSWFVGFDASRVAVVWLGYDDNRSTHLTGAAGAMKIWDRVFAQVAVDPLEIPEDRNWREIEYESGLLATDQCAQVVNVPLPADAVLQVKEGCGINFRNLTERLRRNIGSWFNSN
jgi:penicillin-binding protein 1B